uniref:RHD domain-containing protein n=1 Tax=Strigamia maritima TaxID=126957 RepID=T1JD11_STRMM
MGNDITQSIRNTNSLPAPQNFSNLFLAIVDGEQFTLIGNPNIISTPTTMSPEIEIIEQPTKSFRFRYASETGSHGSLLGTQSTRKNRSYPKIRVSNLTKDNIRNCSGRVKIRAILYHFDQKNGYIQHVHKLDGKNCSNGIYEAEHDVTNPNTIVEFNGVHINHVAKRNVKNTLLERYRADMDENTAVECANSMAKILERNVNEVQIGFHAEIFLPTSKSYVELCPPVYTHTITNRKSANAGDLNIVRLSHCSGRVEGHEEVILLCEKVEKKNIKVRFFQLDKNNDEILWTAYGEFNDSHVHKQVAITFRTPPYKDQSIENEVQVYVQLVRPSDESEGDSKIFTYTPNEFGHKQKKAKMLDFTSKSENPPDQQTIAQRQTLKGRRKGLENLKIDAKGGSDRDASGASCTETSSSVYVPDTAEVIERLSEFPLFPKQFSAISEIEEDLLISSNPFLNPNSNSNSDDIVQSALNEAEININSGGDPTMNVTGEFDEDMLSEVEEGVSRSQNVMMGSTDPLLCGSSMPVDEDEIANWISSWITPSESNMVSRGSGEDVDDDYYDEDIVEDGPAVADSRRLEIASKLKIAGRQDGHLVYRLAVKVANSLLDYARSEDVKLILKPMVELIAYSDANGDNAIHLAVIHAKLGALEVLLETMYLCPKISRIEIVNAFNNLTQTPLHIAVCNGDVKFVKILLSNGVDPNLRDKRGNNSVHVAVQNCQHDDIAILNELLKTPNLNLDVINNGGFTPLHLAVMNRSLKAIAALLNANATIDCRDGTAGRTPLHIAVQNIDIPLVRFLLDEKADPDMKMFNGRSSLHLAVLIQSEEIVSLLMLAYADPYMQSDELATLTSLDSSDDDLNVDEAPVDDLDSSEQSNGLNCFDMAKDNEVILSILHGNQPSPIVELTTGPDSGYKSVPVYDSGLSLPKYDEVLAEKHFPKQHDEDSGMGLCQDDDSECGYLGQRENTDSGINLSKSEMALVDSDTTISLSKLLDPPGEKDWTDLAELEFGLEALGSEDGLEIIHQYKSSRDGNEKRNNLTKMMGKLKINH